MNHNCTKSINYYTAVCNMLKANYGWKVNPRKVIVDIYVEKGISIKACCDEFGSWKPSMQKYCINN